VEAGFFTAATERIQTPGAGEKLSLITVSGSPCGCPAFTTIHGVHPAGAGQKHGQAVPVTAQYTTEAEYEAQLRALTRVVSACTLGLWSFSAGLLIGTFLLF
jgi:hypothetical protein